MAHVFISYVRDDKEIVDQLASQLSRAGVHVWLDRDEIQPGVDWQRAIAEAIQTGGHFLACFSTAYHSRDRSYMNEELTQAIKEFPKRRPDPPWLVPVRLDDCEVPPRDMAEAQPCAAYSEWTCSRTGTKEYISS